MCTARADAAYDDPPRDLIPTSTTLARVREQYHAAHPGARSKNALLVEDWHLVQDGQTGTFRVDRLGRDYRETTTLGPLVYVNGMHAGVRWQQNRNGITFTFSGIHQRDAVSERSWDSNDPRDVRLIGESVPLNAFVVEVDPPGGRHEWLFIDKHSGQIVRRDRIERNRRLVTTYDAFRPFDGEELPGRIRTVDSLGNEREQTLLWRSLDPGADADALTIEPNRRTLVEFPPGFAEVHLPVRVVNGLFVVRVLVDGRPFDFLLDSGAAGIVVDPLVVDALGLERYGLHVGATIGPFPETTTIVPSMTIGSLHMRNVVSRVVSIPFRADEHTRVAGLLGFDFFAELVLHVDTARGAVEAFHAAAFRVPDDVVPVPLGLDDKQPAVRVKVGPVAARVILDTGSNRTLLSAAFAQKLAPGDDIGATTGTFRSVGGTGTAQSARIGDLEFAGATFAPTVEISAADFGFEDVDGLIGTDLMRDLDLWFEYRTNTIYVRRSAREIGRRASQPAVRRARARATVHLRPPRAWTPR